MTNALLEQLALAEELRTLGRAQMEPSELPGRYGRVIRDLERLLAATGAPAVVAGGWAVWHHGYVGRVTQDVDIVIPTDSQESLLRIAPICGFEVLPLCKGRWPKMTHRESEIEVDLLPEASIPGTPTRLAPVPIRHPSEYGAESGALHFIELAGLCELKLGAHRAKDMADLVELIKVNPQRLEELHARLEIIHPSYAAEFAELIQQANEEKS
jgi:hypothetical protein